MFRFAAGGVGFNCTSGIDTIYAAQIRAYIYDYCYCSTVIQGKSRFAPKGRVAPGSPEQYEEWIKPLCV